MLKLYTDTDTDFTPEAAKEYGYKLISMPYVIDGKEYKPYVDFEKFDAHAFYDMLRGGVMPTTNALNAEDYKDIFEEDFKAGNEILYVHFSAAMSGTFNSLALAVKELSEKYPDAKFYTLDTKGITILSYAMLKDIGDMYKAGKGVKDILQWAEKEIDKYTVYFYADNLKFFARSGRVSGFSAFMGNLLGIHPIIYISSDGIMTSCAKVRGANNTLKTLVKYVEDLGDDVKNHRIVIGHADCIQIVEKLIKMLEEKFGKGLNIEVVDVNPTAGCHCGPDCVGISFYAKHR